MWIPSWIALPALFIAWPFYFMWWELPYFCVEGIDEYATGRNPVQMYWARKQLSQKKPVTHWTSMKWYWTPPTPYDELYEQTCGLD